MNRITCFTVGTVSALVLSACIPSRTPTPTNSDTRSVQLIVQTQNGSTTFSQVGEIITYNYLITNTGASPLAGPVLVMDGSKSVNCNAVNTVGNQDNYLDPNETIPCSAPYTISQADVTAGSVTNTATATVGGVTSAPTGITLTLVTPPTASVLKLAKTSNSQTYSQAGQSITYTYVITNTGPDPLGPAQFTVTDNKLGAPLNCGPGKVTLAPNQSVSCTATYTITQADMNLANVINSASASGGGQTSAPVTVTIVNLSPPTNNTAIPPTTTALIRIVIDPGQSSAVRLGVINPRETTHFVLGAVQGQTLSLKLTVPANEVAMGVNSPTGLALKPLDASPVWSTSVTVTGDHFIDLMSLTDGSSVSYVLEVNLSPPAAITPSPVSASTGQIGRDAFAREECCS